MSDFLPVDFENRMKLLLGDSFSEFEKSYETDRHRGLRANLLKQSVSGEDAVHYVERVSKCEPIPWTDCGFYYDEDSHPGKHPLHEAGVYYIQEPSAMTPGMLIGAKPGECVLDLCAAPGGKTTQIAAAMQGKGLLIANEINPQRAKILAENVERMGIKNAVVTNESSEKLALRFEGFFDRIMVDAPCSGEGMFRKNDEAISEWSLDNIKMCAERQAEILDNAALMLKQGGTLVYSTCTFAPEENELGIKAFLDRHSEFTLADMSSFKEKLGQEQQLNAAAFGMDEAIIKKTVRLWPHKINGEGHFAAVLVKISQEEYNISYGENVSAPVLEEAPLSKGDRKKLMEYLGDILDESCFDTNGILGTGRLESFGDNIYIVPAKMQSLGGLKIMRAGLQIGSKVKDRFEPAHALAHAITPSMAKRVSDLLSEDAADYIKGLTKNIDGEKGWVLVCVNGFSLGWGKNAGGVLKNHYPKGLRKG